MKDKNDLLVELDELRQVRDDLTHEVTRLTTDLEKERSKCHGLKGDIDKAKVCTICRSIAKVSQTEEHS